jgi:anti-anti-sigma regulatory factor
MTHDAVSSAPSGVATPATAATSRARYQGPRRSRNWPCPSPASFSLLVRYDRRDVVLVLAGDMRRRDTRAFASCVAVVNAERPRRLILDLSALQSFDEPCVAAIAEAGRSCAVAGVELVVLSGAPELRARLARTVDVTWRH